MSRDLFGSTFSTVRMDPPWPERGGGKSKRGADRHYPLVRTLDDLVAVITSCPHWDRVASDAHLYMDVTNRFMVGGDYSDHDGPAWGPELARRLHFRPVTLLTWAKTRDADADDPQIDTSIGQYFRGQTEQILFAVRGDGMGLRRKHTDRRDLGGLICAPTPRDETGRRIHSRKPTESYELIEAASPGPYLEIFARIQYGRQWTPWGLDAPEAT